MPSRRVLILEDAASPWADFLKDYFSETATKPEFVCDAKAAGLFLTQSIPPDLVFANSAHFSLAVEQQLKVLKQSRPEFRLFCLGSRKTKDAHFPFDATFEKMPDLSTFQKKLNTCLPFKSTLQVLVMDDEPEIGEALRDYLEGRSNPCFEMIYAEDGLKGWAALEKQKPDAVVMDIKMPGLKGYEVYGRMKEKGIDIPVIVFFDAISGDEIEQIHKHGKPPVVDKGSQQSSMPEMLALIQKMAFFG